MIRELKRRRGIPLNYMPKRLPDELWINWLARYKQHLDLKDDQALFDLLGTTYGVSGIDFTHKLQYLTSQLREISNETFLDILNKTTLWPYYSFFLKPEAKRNFLNFFDLGVRGKGPVKLRIQQCYAPMYCPVCIQTDIKEFGECYFHRSHQIPEIFICTKHNCYLEQVGDKRFFLTSKLHPASIAICPCRTRLFVAGYSYCM